MFSVKIYRNWDHRDPLVLNGFTEDHLKERVISYLTRHWIQDPTSRPDPSWDPCLFEAPPSPEDGPGFWYFMDRSPEGGGLIVAQEDGRPRQVIGGPYATDLGLIQAFGDLALKMFTGQPWLPGPEEGARAISQLLRDELKRLAERDKKAQEDLAQFRQIQEELSDAYMKERGRRVALEDQLKDGIRNMVAAVEADLEDALANLEDRNGEIQRLNGQLEKVYWRAEDLEDQLKAKEGQNAELEAELKGYRYREQWKGHLIEKHNTTIEDMGQAIKEYRAQVNGLTARLLEAREAAQEPIPAAEAPPVVMDDPYCVVIFPPTGRSTDPYPESWTAVDRVWAIIGHGASPARANWELAQVRVEGLSGMLSDRRSSVHPKAEQEAEAIREELESARAYRDRLWKWKEGETPHLAGLPSSITIPLDGEGGEDDQN